jgi:hypothetical protein
MLWIHWGVNTPSCSTISPYGISRDSLQHGSRKDARERKPGCFTGAGKRLQVHARSDGHLQHLTSAVRAATASAILA